ncbi:NUDIX hydrolase [Puniceibacterium sediminis]|nr:NUDIX hydrolase [Puniceibacterium sediminis]
MKSISIPYAGLYSPTNERDRVNAVSLLNLIQNHEDAFCRSRIQGHVTASAFVVNPAHSHVILTNHAKLDCWLQLGGHCDGERDPLAVAQREAREESGLTDIRVARPEIFDIDIHQIPEHHDTPAHQHYDIRYLLVAEMSEPLRPSVESHDLAWVPLSRLAYYTDKPSVLVLSHKLETL